MIANTEIVDDVEKIVSLCQDEEAPDEILEMFYLLNPSQFFYWLLGLKFALAAERPISEAFSKKEYKTYLDSFSSLI